MRSDQLGPRDIAKTSIAAYFQGFGLGVTTTVRRGDANPQYSAAAGIGTGGWGGAACTSFFSDPCLGITLVFMAQLVGYSATAPTFRKEVHNMAYELFADATATEAATPGADQKKTCSGSGPRVQKPSFTG